jgi:alkanesulfonate monooxygenase SsuD/methylene tetrahydromethanopterin reductase-like flavin-dependent oxidoreductase (luciferase family)
MEFGIFIQGHLPGPQAHDTDAEHRMLFDEVELVKCADRNNWKYVWISEHHALTEYSHISASEVYAGYLAAVTERIHMGSGIFNLSPRVNHPVRNAERVAMLDHLTNRRFEFGTGRGAGSHEVGTFNIHDTSSTRAEWDEVVWELPKMWEREDYTFQGDHFAMDIPHNVLPKPYAPGHPPIWVACGNPPTYRKAGEHGIGALGFNFSPITEMKLLIDEYKAGIAECTNPVGQFVNDNVMLTNAVRCFEDRDKARELATRETGAYLYSLVCLYHDTFPKRPGAPTWPEAPSVIPPDFLDAAISTGAVLCGNPDEVCQQLKTYEATGVDQVVFGMPNDMSTEDALECIETFGKYVIPEYDRDPVHRTDRMRATATPKFGPFEHEPPVIETIHTRAQRGANR